MKIRKILPCVSLAVMVCACGVVGANGRPHALPRDIGAVRLGMSVEQFRRITGVEAKRCIHCTEHELEADLYLDTKLATHMRQKLVNLHDARIVYQPNDLLPELVVCSFYKGRLYSIVLNDVKDTFAAVQSRYESNFGPPAGVEKWDTGYAQVRWESRTTVLNVTYDSKETGIDHLTIDYIDRRIRSSIPREPRDK